ncbi:type II inositol 1,4,5-trisphosphate 5-phosphatase isoform X2 [Paramormyrops kingsleyae]|uniref:type II inositol 1,4,5-trisphosphate 5-phosphatase isoform X2 n=1 Tax=Paramormyrops kingsleyae TaxID=1676925 RepID=UPI003B96CA77
MKDYSCCFKHAAQCLLVVDDATESRLVGLVARYEAHAMFIFTHRRMAITGEDVTLDDIIPVSHNFAIVEVSSPDELAIIGADTRVRVTDSDRDLELRLPFGSHTRLFLSEVNRSWSEVCKKCPTEVPASQFEWLTKYRRSTKGTSTDSLSAVLLQTPSSRKQSGKLSLADRKGHPASVENNVDRRGRGEENRDDLVRSSSYMVSNKAQMLAMPQFGLRDNLIRSELLKKEEQYIYIKNFRFFLGTYNVNGQPPKESLQPWLGFPSDPPDIYCVGFQELDLSKEAFFFSDTPKEQEWMKAVLEGLHQDAKYAFVKLIRLVGIMLLFYVKNEHAEHISEVEAESVGTGIMGRMGNKGAVAIRFRFHNSDICVVNSHLAAHVEEFERRNQDFRDICSRIMFRQKDPGLSPLTILKHDVILWLGDLNYRICELEVDEVKNLIAKKDFETLQKFDQLRRQIKEEAVFSGFVEGEIMFQPTYKYNTGSDQWDSSEKCRVPAWCDRILWKGKQIQQLHYQSHMTLKTSDHKPVSSLMEIGIKVVNEEKYKKTFEEIVRNLDKMENECIPSVSLSGREFQFNDVKFMQEQTKILTIYNDGQVPCQFEFIQKLDESTFCKPWLMISPHQGFLAQGESVDIQLELYVNRSTATDLNSGRQQIEDILVLHLDRGKDYFISITGNYLPSCFGTSLQTLCHLREPIQDMPLETLQQLILMTSEEVSDPITEKPLDIPKEIWMMVDHLYRNASKQEDLFQQPGLRSEVGKIRDCLDTGTPDSLPGSNHSVAEALLLFLDALPEPVVCYSAYQQCLESCSNASQCKKVISSLPQCHKNVFNYLTAFLRELLKYSEYNQLDTSILATIFSAFLLRSSAKQEQAERKKTWDFLTHFLIPDHS